MKHWFLLVCSKDEIYKEIEISLVMILINYTIFGRPFLEPSLKLDNELLSTHPPKT